MITYLNLKTNNRFPQHGVASWFTDFGKIDKLQYHIKPEYKECTKGWKKVNLEIWKKEEISDLIKPFTSEQWIEYAQKWGIACAQEFLETCDYMKPRKAYQMFNPPKNIEIWENQEIQIWFKIVFKQDLFNFIDGSAISFGNIYSLDILKFESHLAYYFDYPKDKDGSMRDFMIQRFGQENTNKFEKLFLSVK